MSQAKATRTINGTLESATTSPAPIINCWIPEKPSGVGIVIFPGGGYGRLAAHEGEGYAEFLYKAGISCFVVNYRLGSDGHRHPAMLEDALAAVSTVRSMASELEFSPDKLGVMGSSAGGHLAAHTLVAWDNYVSDISLRPDFGVLCYPVIQAEGPTINKGSIRNLTGGEASSELLQELSCDKQVNSKTPPCFIWHTVEDQAVPIENSMAFASALRKNNIPFELHLYNKGRHGLGLDTTFDWKNECLRWIEETATPETPLNRDNG